MGIKNTFFTLLKSSFLIILLLCAGCALFQRDRGGAKKISSPTAPEQDGFEQDENLPPPSVDEATSPRVALILGPGGYRSFAHALIIKELVKARVPIEKVVGIEWGALAGAFFALEGKPHEAEWKLYKLEKRDLDSKGGIFASDKGPRSTKELQTYLKENLLGRDLRSMKISFTCPSLSLRNGTVSFFDRGSAAVAVEMCLSFAPRWAPARGGVAAGLSTADAADRLRKEGFNVIILVDVLGKGRLDTGSSDLGAQILWNEVRRNVWMAKSHVTDVIEVDMKGVGLFDLESRKKFSQAAEKIAQDAVRRLATKYSF